MPHLLLRLFPLLSLLGVLAGTGWHGSLRSGESPMIAIAANGMAIDPDGRGNAPVSVPEPTDPDL